MLGGYYLGQQCLGQSGFLSINQVSSQNSNQTHTVDNVSITQQYTLVASDTSHSQMVGSVVAIKSKALVIDNTFHGISVDNALLTQDHLLATNNTLHKIKPKSIAKLFNWDELNLYFGLYKQEFRNSGTLEIANLDEPELLKTQYQEKGTL